MKKILFLIALFAGMGMAHAQTAANNGVALPLPADYLKLPENTHNFGKIPQGRPAVYVFEIENTGATPMTLDNVQASCGCTTPEWSRDPIAAGGTAKIKVGYNAYAEGPFTKTVTLFYNTSRTKTITISGEVYKAPASSAPENESIQFLKQINR
ncbi:MAG: DUF1573 domain-containing protein [Bacteroidota bacterium]|nr:DUF1573 domain-containing protein [Bacteroidota bacterium]MDP4218742.1 DUF1573 domain-containing protein [Bacteroidota bacterium]MDP4244680.1 DUF1573 domain-containing protein [Bacteroidota bacterium]MDP4253266.1 DUF1573 domain-containing protein [Bacteroidota bacterium]MDP4256887.1 DUF1573 domain-containing protein [Bacteroidota bacterium]